MLLLVGLRVLKHLRLLPSVLLELLKVVGFVVGGEAIARPFVVIAIHGGRGRQVLAYLAPARRLVTEFPRVYLFSTLGQQCCEALLRRSASLLLFRNARVEGQAVVVLSKQYYTMAIKW